MSFDLNAYFTRIRFTGRAAPDLQTLTQIHLLHTCAIPFENLDVLLGREIQLDDDSVFNKLVTAGRGGYCFEQNGLLKRALLETGFEVEDLAGRVLLSRPAIMPARTHRLALVSSAQGRWLVDVGFGSKTLTAPLKFVPDIEQLTPHGRYKITQVENDFLLSTLVEEGWLPMYRFDRQKQYFSDYEAGNFYSAHWPESRFRHHLVACLHYADGTSATLLDDRLRVGDEKLTLADAAAAYKALQERTGLRFDDRTYGIDLESFSHIFRQVLAG